MPKKTPEYRASRDHSSFISRISDYGVEALGFHDALKSRCLELYEVSEMTEIDIQRYHDNVVSHINSTNLKTPWTPRTRFETKYYN